MPFNFPRLKYYDLDYDIFFDELYSTFHGNLFTDERKTQKYIETYLSYMKEADNKLREFISIPSNQTALWEEVANGQIFQQPIEYENSEIYIHFLVGKLVDLTPDRKKYTKKVSTKLFIGEKARYFWTPAISDKSLATDPVIAAPFPFGYNDFLIIDGNHRLTNWTKSKRKIPVLHASGNSLINMQLFATDFDLLYYAFHCDATNLANLKNYSNYSDEALLNETFLNTGKLAF